MKFYHLIDQSTVSSIKCIKSIKCKVYEVLSSDWSEHDVLYKVHRHAYPFTAQGKILPQAQILFQKYTIQLNSTATARKGSDGKEGKVKSWDPLLGDGYSFMRIKVSPCVVQLEKIKWSGLTNWIECNWCIREAPPKLSPGSKGHCP